MENKISGMRITLQKRVLALIMLVCLAMITLTGCADIMAHMEESDAESDETVFSTEVESEEAEEAEETEGSESPVEDDKEPEVKNPYFFQNGNAEYKYAVKHLIDMDNQEGLSEVPVKVEKCESYNDGDVYSIRILYDKFDGNAVYDPETRMNVGTFYVTKDKIYLLMYRDDIPSEDEFLKDGIVVYSETDSSEILESENEQVEIEHDGDICTCRMWSTVGESGFYYTYEWTKGKGLTLFRSGYGAEGEPIEISLQKDGSEKIKFSSEKNEFEEAVSEEAGNASLCSIVTDLDKDGKNEAFVIAGDESTMDSTVMTDDDDATYWAVDHVWFVDENGKSEELSDLTNGGLMLSMTQSTFEVEDNSYVILNGYNGVDGVGMVYTLENDKLINAAPDTWAKGHKNYDGEELIWKMEYYGEYVDDTGIMGHIYMPYHLCYEKGTFKLYGSKEVSKDVIDKFDGIGTVFLYDAKKTQFILRDNNELDINYMTGEENDYTVNSKVYKLDEESGMWELESTLDGYFLVDPQNPEETDFLAEYQG
ncbi:hypothetical protein SAMN06296386_102316 [Lachnospiraceae bacterium]|nr:hypothetical protein SAMN06296386_102316 [Lachnospiraceae bacterium]